MAKQPAGPPLGVAEELRQIIARRRRKRRILAIGSLLCCLALLLGATMVRTPPALLLWNATASAPKGLYYVDSSARMRRGDMVAAWTPQPARSLASDRRYLPANVPLVKRVAAAAGDQVCALGHRLSINGRQVALRKEYDRAGRAMPWWNGCRILKHGEYFLLMEGAGSFDGRYFGVSREQQILGRAISLWTGP